MSSVDVVGPGGTTDPLTGLLDRRALRRNGAQVVSRARTGGDGVFAAVIEVGGVREVARRSGGDAVDEVVMVVAQALRDVCAPGDVVARTGPAAFAVVAAGTGEPAEVLAARLLRRLHRISPLEDGTWEPAVSVGAAVLDPWDDGDLATLLAAAGHTRPGEGTT